MWTLEGQNGNPMSATDVIITACNDGSLCCGNSNAATACCASGQGVWIVNGQVTNVNPSGTSENENFVINAPPHPATAVRPRHYLRWAGIVVLGVIVSGTLLGWLTERTSLDRYWSLVVPTHRPDDPATRDNPNQMLTALVSSEQVERKALSERMTALAGRHNFALLETVEMPANNFSVIFRRDAS